MKIFIVCMLHSYGDPKREFSFEYFNFYKTFQGMGHEVEIFDYMGEINQLGKVGMNKKLLDLVREGRWDVVIFSLYTDQLDPEVVNKTRQFSKTFCFFHDDTWRVGYSRFWAQYFDFFSTPDMHGESKYREIGLKNAIYFPFGCNEKITHKLDLPKMYDVSFVGGWHPWRQWLINRIRKSGFSVMVAGHGWPNGELNQKDMVTIFNKSRINLNLSNSASWDFRYLISSPRAILNRLVSKKNIEQMKARIFEINACGGFQLTYMVEGLAGCYEIDRELVVYVDPDDLIEKIRFYISHPELRESIAEAGHLRTLQDHTFERRFRNVFHRMGLAYE